jgi:hypothetical protein
MQRKLQHRSTVQLALPGKAFEPIKEVGFTAERNHMKSGHTGSMPAL